MVKTNCKIEIDDLYLIVFARISVLSNKNIHLIKHIICPRIRLFLQAESITLLSNILHFYFNIWQTRMAVADGVLALSIVKSHRNFLFLLLN